METDPAKNLTKTKHFHNCLTAHRKNTTVAPDQSCIDGEGTCSTETFVVRSVRRFKTLPGRVKVTWMHSENPKFAGFMSWEDDPRSA